MAENTETGDAPTMPRRRLIGLVSGAAFVGLSGCGGDGTDGTTPTEPTTTPSSSPTATETSTGTTTAGSTPTETTPTPTGTPEDGWTQLFDGEGLGDWTRKFSEMSAGEEHNNTIRVEDGLLRIAYDDYDEWNGTIGHLYYDEEFSHYAVRVEYRFPDTYSGGTFRNSGVMIHGPTPEEALGGEFPRFPSSIEMQLLGQDEGGGERTTANLCTPGAHVVMDGGLTTQHCIDSSSDTYRGDQWVTATAVVRGSEEIRHYVGGQEVLSYAEPQLNDGTILSEGTVSLQAEGSPIDFRRVELREIDPDAPLGEGFVPPTPPSVSVSWPFPSEIRVASESTGTVSAEITNEDDAPITDGEVSLEPSSSEIAVSSESNTTFDSLAPGASQTATWSVTLPGDLSSGDYAFRAVLSYTRDGAVSETTGTLSFTVT